MSIIATALKHLIAAGVSGDDLVRAVAEMEDSAPRDRAADKRRAYDRERKRAKKAVSTGIPPESAESAERAPLDDIYSNPPDPSEANASEPPFSEKVVSAWNDGPAKRGARRANKLDTDRRKHLNARVKEHGEQAVFDAIRGIATSDWHCGIGSNGWRADIGWLLRSPANFLKGLERAEEAALPAPVSPADHAAFQQRMRDAPWMRGRENEFEPPRANGTGPPRFIGQLAAGIAGSMAH